MGKKILGISAFYHDSAACLIDGSEIIAAAQEERFTRRKHDRAFPAGAIQFCLERSGCSLAGLDAVVFYDKPLLKFERILETYYAYAPRGIRSFLKFMPGWIKEKVFLKKLIRDELGKICGGWPAGLPLLFSDHHLSHGASAFFPSPFAEAAILTIDGAGEWATASIAAGKGNSIKTLKEMRFPHSAGLLYSAFTYYLGFKVNSGEYKVMGLAPYGDDASGKAAEYAGLIKKRLVRVNDDGSIRLNPDYFDYAVGFRMAREDRWARLFGFKARSPEAEIEPCHCRLALAIQTVTEEIVLKMARTARELTGSGNLCLAGGVALNCVANSKLLGSGLFKNIWIQPAAGDAGGALGAALAVNHMYFSAPRPDPAGLDAMKGAYLGPEFSDTDVKLAVEKFKADCSEYEDFGVLCGEVAGRLARGKVAGWFQGRMEWGPRALGNRSILGDPRDPEMQRRLNLKVKYRESFRPFAPAVPWADARSYFSCDAPSPYMLSTADVLAQRRRALPPGYKELPVREKLYYPRSDIPAVTHLDHSARLQTVHGETNPEFLRLLAAFKEKTGCAVLINTSFNVRGEPIVRTPEDAYRCFMRTDMDFLVIGNRLFDKARQPAWKEAGEWKEEFVLD